MKLLNHPTCIRLIEVLSSKTTIFLVLELVTGGELFDRVVSDGKFDEDTARNYFRQLISGLEHCHAHGVCHRDLKPENLLLDARGNLKITDFGLASLRDPESEDGDLLHTACGTPNYVAPEVLMEKGYHGPAADIWSAGVILYVLLAGFLPFDEAVMVELFRKIITSDFQYPSWVSPEAQVVINRMLDPDPDRRARIAEIRASAFFTGTKLVDPSAAHFDEAALFGDGTAPIPLSVGAAQQQGPGTPGAGPGASSSGHRPRLSIMAAEGDIIAAAATAQAKADAAGGAPRARTSKWKGQRSVSSQSAEFYAVRVGTEAATAAYAAAAAAPAASTSAAGSEGADGDAGSVRPALAGLSLDTSSGGASSGGPGSVMSPPPFASPASPAPSGPLSGGAGGPTMGPGGTPLPTGSGSADGADENRTGPRSLNAFDLINMVSGQSMNNMLLFNKSTAASAPPSFTQFTSREPTADLMMRLDFCLLETANIRYRICYRRCQVTLVWTSAKNHKIGAHIDVFHLTPELHMVQCKRVHGSILAHHEFYKLLRDTVKASESSTTVEALRARLQEWDADHVPAPAPAAAASSSTGSSGGSNAVAVGEDGSAAPAGGNAADESSSSESGQSSYSLASATSMLSAASLPASGVSGGARVTPVPLAPPTGGERKAARTAAAAAAAAASASESGSGSPAAPEGGAVPTAGAATAAAPDAAAAK